MMSGKTTGNAHFKGHRGFTLLELMVVMVIIGLLSSLAAPVVSQLVLKSKESVLKKNLHTTRMALDDYFADHGDYPDSLQNLVDEKYLRTLPYDPIAGSDTAWQELEASREGLQGIEDIRSGVNTTAVDGSYYSDW